MKYATRTKAAGGQQWHRQRVKNPGISVVNLPDCGFIEKERMPVPDMREKEAMKQAVRADVSDYPAHLITVIPAGKKAKRGIRK